MTLYTYIYIYIYKYYIILYDSIYIYVQMYYVCFINAKIQDDLEPDMAKTVVWVELSNSGWGMIGCSTRLTQVFITCAKDCSKQTRLHRTAAVLHRSRTNRRPWSLRQAVDYPPWKARLLETWVWVKPPENGTVYFCLNWTWPKSDPYPCAFKLLGISWVYDGRHDITRHFTGNQPEPQWSIPEL